jgi:hypothetical protein
MCDHQLIVVVSNLVGIVFSRDNFSSIPFPVIKTNKNTLVKSESWASFTKLSPTSVDRIVVLCHLTCCPAWRAGCDLAREVANASAAKRATEHLRTIFGDSLNAGFTKPMLTWRNNF